MLTGSDVLASIEGAFPGQVRRSFQFPFTRLRVTTRDFDGLDDDEREETVAQRAAISIADLRGVCNRTFLRLDLLTVEEAAARPPADRGHFWMRELAEPDQRPDPVDAELTSRVPVVHFYGYKGGQARSSALCVLSRILAMDGWRVLALDVDVEAPSLDILFDVRADGPASSLLGVRAGLAVRPVRAVTSARRGCVDLLPFRPPEERYDLDAAALAMEGSVFPQGLGELVTSVAKIASDYDVVLVDHRTGLASTVPPWVRHLPGPVVAFARMDGQWRQAKSSLRKLWSHAPDKAGVLVSFNADAGEDETDYRRRTWGQASELLEELVAARNSLAHEDEEPLTADEIRDHWIVWPFDSQLTGIGTPALERVSSSIREQVYTMRRLLGLQGSPKKDSKSASVQLNSSGAVDEGDLIQTQALLSLRQPNNPYMFILGRKGTGKTRLLRALAAEKLGEPLLVPSDDRGTAGVQATDSMLLELIRETEKAPEAFWWTLLCVALEGGGTERGSMYRALGQSAGKAHESLSRAREASKKQTAPRVFLIDGLELAFSRHQTFDFIAALLRVVATLDSDSVFNDKVKARIFFRTDLAERGYENFEQQAQRRRLSLSWDTKTILNFALSRIGRLSWFEQQFPKAVSRINEKRGEILEGALSEQECDVLLTAIFPKQLPRQNLNTTTFLRTYFSDDPKAQGSYYPRIYDEFLRIIAGEDKDARRQFSGAELKQDRVSDELVYFAHEQAAKSFLLQVRAELYNLVNLSTEDVGKLIDAFQGSVTPFDVEQLARQLAERTILDKVAVREALERMKTLGIFEDRPKYPRQWRAGRLFKTSLGMIYDRKRK